MEFGFGILRSPRRVKGLSIASFGLSATRSIVIVFITLVTTTHDPLSSV